MHSPKVRFLIDCSVRPLFLAPLLTARVPTYKSAVCLCRTVCLRSRQWLSIRPQRTEYLLCWPLLLTSLPIFFECLSTYLILDLIDSFSSARHSSIRWLLHQCSASWHWLPQLTHDGPQEQILARGPWCGRLSPTTFDTNSTLVSETTRHNRELCFEYLFGQLNLSRPR